VDAARSAGALHAYLIEEPLAGAIGAGLPVGEPVGSLVVDVGGGTSEMAVTALGSMVVSHSIRVGGYELDEAIVRVVQQQERLLIGQEQAEALKIAIGSATKDSEEAGSGEVAGRDLVSALLRRVSIDPSQVREALAGPLSQIVDAVKDVLERTPEALFSDIADRGLTLVGGGSLLRGFDDLLRREIGLTVTVSESPLTAVARGAGAALEELEALERSIAPRRRGHSRQRIYRG
jgi:rod shape-determining protein MreB and related proteins